MKKRLRLFAALYAMTLCASVQPAMGQISATLSIRTPAPPQLSTWINDRTVVQLIVINRGSAAIPNCRASFFIRNIENGNVLVRSDDNSGAVPVFTIPAGVSTTTFFGRDLVSEQAITYDQNLIATAVTTNSIPEGSYEFCARILNAAGQTIAEVPCRAFTVLIPDPPTIVSPVDEAELLTTSPPTFVWTPVQFVGNVRYNLRIAPLFAGQNRRQAIESNAPLLNQTGIVGTSFFYGPSLPSFSLYAQAIGWVWQVQAVDMRGAPVTRNEGRSEIGAFKFKPPVAQLLPKPIMPQNPITPQKPMPTIQPPAPPPLPFQPTLQPPMLQNSVLKGRIVYTYFGAPNVKPNETLPLRNTPIKLSLYRYGKNFSGTSTGVVNASNLLQMGSPERPVYIKMLATTTTDANGNFTFSFVQTDSMGYRGKKTTNTYSYHEYIVARVEVENPYFTSPENDIFIQPKETIDLNASSSPQLLNLSNPGQPAIPQPMQVVQPPANLPTPSQPSLNPSSKPFQPTQQPGPVTPSPSLFNPNLNPVGPLVARARTFDLTLTVRARNVSEDQNAAFKGQAIPGAKVYVLRETVPTNLPQEGNVAGAPNLQSVRLGAQAGSQTAANIVDKWLFNLKVVSTGITDASGKVTFKLVRNMNINDHYIIWATIDSANAFNYQFLAQRFTSMGEWSSLDGFQPKVAEDKDAKWNNEYPSYSQCQRQMTLFGVPQLPRVSGAVYFAQNANQPVENAKVDLRYFAVFFLATEATQITGANGYFEFSGLPTTIGEFGAGKSMELIRGVRVSKSGYEDKSLAVNNGKSLQRGQRAWLGKILIEPKATVSGSVVDAETGEGVPATVTFQDGVAVQTTQTISFKSGDVTPKFSPGGFMGVGAVSSSGMSTSEQRFTAKAPTGNNIRVVVRPNNQNYFSPETLFVNIPSNMVTLEPFKVYQKKRRIQIRVLEQVSPNPLQNLQANKMIQGAKVTITNLPNKPSVLTSPQGVARFEPFFNASNNYAIRVETTDDSDFLTTEIQYNSVFVESKNYITATVFLPRAGRISGKVTVGKNATSVAGARVRLVSNGSGLPIETFTDENGKYVLRKVPLGQGLKFRAAKSQSQLVGTDTTLNVTGAHANINFALREYNDMDITKLWGFPIEVDDLREQAGQVIIDGSFVSIPDNSQFKLADDDSALAFANVPIEPSGINNEKGLPIAKPKNSQIVVTDKNVFREVRVYDQFLAKVFDPTGLKVAPLENNSDVGVVRGRVYARRSSFNLSTGSLEFEGSATSDTAFHLLRPDKSGNEKLVIPTLTANAQPAVSAPQGFQIGNAAGGNLKFKLYGFESEAESAGSFLSGGSAKLKTRLHTAFTNVSPADINLDIGAVEVKQNGVQPISGTAKIAIPLGTKWTLESSDWSLSAQSGFTLKTGAIKTGGVDIGFTGIKVEPTRLETAGGATYNFSNLPIAGGIAAMTAPKSSIAQLGYDPGQQKWSFTISKGGNNDYAAVVDNLPNCAPTDRLLFNNVTLFSDGTSGYTLQSNHPELTVYKVAKFKPSGVSFYENLIQLSGQVNYGIPQLQPITTLLEFRKQGGSVAASVAPAEFEIKPNAVTMKFPNAEGAQTLDATGFTAKGKIYEIVGGGKKMFEFNITLRKTPNGAIAATLDEGQVFNFSEGKSKLKNLAGGLKPVSQSAWEQFKFEGDMESDDGVSGRLAFVVKGDIQTDIGNQKVDVKNIETPFGQLNLTYDFAKKRLEGSISLDMNAGSYALEGSANVRFDPQGWFFTALARVKLQNPAIDFQIGAVLGKYPNIKSISEITSKFAGYQWKPEVPDVLREIPAEYNDLKGFYFLGEATNFIAGISIPNIDVDLKPVYYYYLKGYYGVALALGMNFAGSTQIDVGAAAFVRVEAGGGTVTSVVSIPACFGGYAMGSVTVYAKGSVNLSNKSWSAIGGADFIVAGGFHAGIGLCNAKCEDLVEIDLGVVKIEPCIKIEKSISYAFGCQLKIGPSGISLSANRK